MGATRSISYSMTKTVLLLTLFLGLIIGSLQVMWDYQRSIEVLNLRVEEVLNSIEKTALKAAFNFDNDLAEEVATGLFEFQPISSVVILDEDGRLMTTLERYAGKLPFNMVSELLFQNTYSYDVPLISEAQPDIQLGLLKISITPHLVVEEFWNRAIGILWATLLQSFLLSTVLLILFHRRITKPLQDLATDFTQIDPQHPSKTKLSLPAALHDSEFHEVTRAGNALLNVIGTQLIEKNQSEQKLKAQKDETERYLQIAEAIILQLDQNGRIVMINQRGLDLLAYDLDEILGLDWVDFAIAEEDQGRIRRFYAELFASNYTGAKDDRSSYFEGKVVTRDGQHRLVFWHNALERDSLGLVSGVLCSGQDITERKRAEDALRVTEGSLRAIIEATSEGFAITDLTSMQLLDINSSLYEMLGYRRDEVLGRKVTDFIAMKDIAVLNDYVDSFKVTPHQNFEISMIHKDGHEVPVAINASTLPFSIYQTPRSVAFISNISERKKQEENRQLLENQLRQAQKMETIGTLAGGIAHDFNNILTPILGYSSLLADRIPPEDPNHERIHQISIAAKRATEMIKQILTFSRRREGEKASTSLFPVVHEALSLLESTTPANIEIRAYLDDQCPPVIADATQIQQVVMNLCTNAIHAMQKEGGTLDVHLKTRDILHSSEQIFANMDEATYLHIQISDSGHGMNEATITRIFDPFFTTKKSGDGTGLGLAMVHGIVQSHHGHIYVESRPGHGSTFHVYLPLSDIPAQAPANSHKIYNGSGENILIIDDEKLNTQFLQELVVEIGYHCTCFNDSIEALDAYLETPDKYDLILTDQTMPKLSGDQLVRAIREISPQVRIVMMSGFDQKVSPDNAKSFGLDAFIQKPVSLQTLSQTIYGVLHHDFQDRVVKEEAGLGG